MASLTPPAEFLNVIVHDSAIAPSLSGLCAGFEDNEWRGKQLADHLTEWLPEFALTPDELASTHSGTLVSQLRKAAKLVYTSPSYANRGEVGELLLHAVLRQVFGTIPAISKIYFKDATNSTVKGFDAVHIVASESSFELWLGEVKLYTDMKQAIRDVITELKAHSDADYLRREFLVISTKVPDTFPQKQKLHSLLHPNQSLDAIVDSLAFPVLLAYEGGCIEKHTKLSEQYRLQFEAEVREHYKTFTTKSSALPRPINIHLILIPLKSKSALLDAFDTRLKGFQ